MLPPTMLYHDSDQKRKRDNDRILAATKRLRLVSTGPVQGGRTRGGTNQEEHIMEPHGMTHPRPPPPVPRHEQHHNMPRDPHPRAGDIVYAADGFMPMPEGHGRRFCAAFLRKGKAC